MGDEKEIKKHIKIDQAIEHLKDSVSMLNGLLNEIAGEEVAKITEESKKAKPSLESLLIEGADLIMGESSRIRDLVSQIRSKLF